MLETLFGLLSFCTGTSGSEPQSFLMDGTLSNSKKSHTNHVDSFVERGVGLKMSVYILNIGLPVPVK